MSEFITLMGNTSLLSNILFLVGGIAFLWYIIAHNNDTKSPINLTDLLLDSSTKKLSLNRFGQFIGIFVSTWAIVFLIQTQTSYSILPMLFPAWLAYLGGSFMFNNYLKSKQDKKEGEDK
jgi:hypothetical protein